MRWATLTLLWLSLLMIASPAGAADVQTITRAVTASGALKPAYAGHISVSVSGDLVTVSAYSDSRDIDDLKIEAIMIGKAIMQSGGDDINRVKCLFLDPRKPDAGNVEVDVSRAHIDAFGKGATTDKNVLLGSIGARRNVQQISDIKLYGLVPGPLMDKRKMIKAYLEHLQTKGVSGLDAFMKYFQNIEGMVLRSESEPVIDRECERMLDALEARIKVENEKLAQQRLQQQQSQQAAAQRSRTLQQAVSAYGRMAGPGAESAGDTAASSGSAGGRLNYEALAEKYPAFVPAREGPEYDWRLYIARCFLTMASNGQDITPLAADFQAAERLAASGDRQGLEQRLRVIQIRHRFLPYAQWKALQDGK